MFVNVNLKKIPLICKHWEMVVPCRSTNFIDVILQRLEKYATNLEELVKQRKKQLLHEKRKSDKLLYRLLPR